MLMSVPCDMVMTYEDERPAGHGKTRRARKIRCIDGEVDASAIKAQGNLKFIRGFQRLQDDMYRDLQPSLGINTKTLGPEIMWSSQNHDMKGELA